MQYDSLHGPDPNGRDLRVDQFAEPLQHVRTAHGGSNGQHRSRHAKHYILALVIEMTKDRRQQVTSARGADEAAECTDAVSRTLLRLQFLDCVYSHASELAVAPSHHLQPHCERQTVDTRSQWG